MKRIFVGVAALMLIAVPGFAGQASDDARDPARPTGNETQGFGGPVWAGPEGGVLFDNGPLVNCPGCGVGGVDESILQNISLGMSTYGFGHQVVNNNRVADDFTVPAGQTWDIGQITFFAYQTGAGNVSTITAVNLQIWDGVPGEVGSNVVFGDTTTNRLSDTSWTEIYRVTEEDSGINTDRAIMANVVTVGTSLGEGTYWLDWQSDGSLASGPWAPPVTINGQNTTGNARQFIGDTGTWDDIVDGATLTAQGMPFIIETGGGNVGIQLSIVGQCPGDVTLTASGGTPNGAAGVIFSFGLGNDLLGGGPCAGEQTQLMNPQLATIAPLDGSGGFQITRNFQAQFCGTFIQLVDAADNCTLSDAEQLP